MAKVYVTLQGKIYEKKPMFESGWRNSGWPRTPESFAKFEVSLLLGHLLTSHGDIPSTCWFCLRHLVCGVAMILTLI
jgi:hypothetical protein